MDVRRMDWDGVVDSFLNIYSIPVLLSGISWELDLIMVPRDTKTYRYRKCVFNLLY